MKRIIFLATISRCFVLFLQAIANYIIPDHESKDAFRSIEDISNNNYGDRIVQILFGGLKRWDAEHFIHIAKYGYTYENNLAFFPLFPLSLFSFRKVFLISLSYILEEDSLFLIAAVFLNVSFFVLSAVVLFKLSALVLTNKILAYYATVLFCFNPASIFFTAPYSESLFTFCTFYGLLLLESNHSLFLVSILFALSGGTRANGIINSGFILYKILIKLFQSKDVSYFYLAFTGVISLIVTTFPFILYQVYTYFLFCKQTAPLPSEIQLKAQMEHYVMPGMNVSWCDSTLPISYSYVQQKYWNVGFLRYFEFKQIPNFLIATPILFFSLQNSSKFILNHKISIENMGSVKNFSPYSLRLFPYIIHITFLTLFCLFCAHVQIATRMLASASPVLYWFGASVLVNNSKFLKRKIENQDLDVLIKNIKSIILVNELDPLNMKAVYTKYICYFYCVVGTVLFSNGYPWT